MKKALLYSWNVLVIIGMAAALRYGFIEATQANDTTGITWGIVGIFILSQVAAWWPGNDKRGNFLYDAATMMVMMGVVGTIVGFMSALESVSEGDTSGVSTALWTTLVGLVGSMCNFVTHRLMGGQKG